MNKNEFLSILNKRLTGLPEDDTQKLLDYYSEIIDDRIEEGLSETEAVEAFGSVDSIVSQILMDTSLPKLVKIKAKSSRRFKVWEIILLALGSPLWVSLLLAVMLIIIALYIILWSVIVSLYSIDLSFALSAVVGILGGMILLFTGEILQGILMLGIGLFCVGVAILMYAAVSQVTKGILYISKKILQGIKTCFIRKGD